MNFLLSTSCVLPASAEHSGRGFHSAQVEGERRLCSGTHASPLHPHLSVHPAGGQLYEDRLLLLLLVNCRWLSVCSVRFYFFQCYVINASGSAQQHLGAYKKIESDKEQNLLTPVNGSVGACGAWWAGRRTLLNTLHPRGPSDPEG